MACLSFSFKTGGDDGVGQPGGIVDGGHDINISGRDALVQLTYASKVGTERTRASTSTLRSLNLLDLLRLDQEELLG